MQKTYDLSENVLPKSINTSLPTDLEFAEYLVKTYLQAYGFTTLKQITHLKTGELIRKNVGQALKTMLQEGAIQQLNIENMQSLFINKKILDKSLNNTTSNIQILSPFDNSIIHRDRLKQFFDFDYKMECYTPKEKRQFGYFCLPILFGNTFIGRVDCKAHRKEKIFELIHLHIEDTIIDIELWSKTFKESVKTNAVFNDCPNIKLTKISPSRFTDTLSQLMEKE